MSYSNANLSLVLQAPAANGKKVWMYTEATTAATVDASAYISDGYSFGMRDGDLLLFYNSTSKIWTAHTVVNASGTTIDLGDGTTIGTSTNSD